MFKNPFVRFVQARTVKNKFNIIIGLILVILLFSLLDFWFGIKVMSGIRGYVGGEGLWSKAQKEELSNLIQYARTGNEAYYNSYMELTVVQLGDMHARLELDKPSPNYDLVQQGFIQGQNNIGDVDDMTFLYRQFKRVSYMRDAISVWQKGDREMKNFREVGTQMHDILASKSGPTQPTVTPEQATALAPLITNAYKIDGRLTLLENQFSATLGNGSRNISNSMLRLTVFVTIMLGLLGVAVAVVIARAIIRLDKLKSEFVSLAAHQLRTPLTAINWYAEALLAGSKGPLNTTQHQYVSDLSSGGKRMANLIGDLLKVSSLDLGTYKSELTKTSVSEALAMVIKDLKVAIEKKHLSLQTHIDATLPQIAIDAQLLVGTFQNLLSNSVKYTPEGGSITVDAKRQRQYLIIHVSDTGIGIPARQQGQIFTKLFRADNAQEVDSEGTGLGLYIVKAMALRMGGSVWFTSAEGHGSDFYVKLPLYRGTHVRHAK